MIGLQPVTVKSHIDLELEINTLIEQIKTITNDCRRIIEADEIDRLIVYLDQRQQCMEAIDALRAKQLELPVTLGDNELVELQDRNRQILLEILAMDEDLNNIANGAYERYRTGLLEIRNQRRIQAYEREQYSSSRFLDIKE